MQNVQIKPKDIRPKVTKFNKKDCKTCAGKLCRGRCRV